MKRGAFTFPWVSPLIAMLAPLVIDPWSPPTGFYAFPSGFAPDYPLGVVLVSPTGAAFAMAVNTAAAFHPHPEAP
jgi:hypothetical protein